MRNRTRTLELLREAAAIDDQHAAIFYELGKCYDSMGRTSEAYQAYLRAKELDICPLRILEPMNEAILTIAHQGDIPVVDAKRLFEELSERGIPGRTWLLDHVHPSILGHQRIADKVLDELIRQGFVQPEPEWKRTQTRVYGEHTASLGDSYYVTGMTRLEGVRLWAQGRAEEIRGIK